MPLNALMALYRALADVTQRTYNSETATGSDKAERNAILRQILSRQPSDLSLQRLAMITLIRQAIADRNSTLDITQIDQVLVAMNEVPREEFVSPEARELAYLPTPVQIGYDQTVSHPHMVAVIIAGANTHRGAHVLDVGTGSGYQAAILSRLVGSVVSIEIVPSLAESAHRRLCRLGFDNVDVIAGDGCEGASSGAPYDAIMVAAGAATIPPALLHQLRIGGRLVMPIGATSSQEQLVVATKMTGEEIRVCSLGPARFVPLTGAGDRTRRPSEQPDSVLELCYGAPITG